MLLTNTPDNIAHKNYVERHFGDNWNFVGCIPYEVDPDKNCLGYYSFSSDDNDNLNYLVLFTIDDRFEESEKGEIKEYIRYVKKEFRRRGDDVSEEEILEITFNVKELDLDNFIKNYPYILWFLGCDDGHWFMRFKTIEERDSYINYLSSINTYKELKDVFYPEDNLYKQFVFHSN